MPFQSRVASPFVGPNLDPQWLCKMVTLILIALVWSIEFKLDWIKALRQMSRFSMLR